MPEPSRYASAASIRACREDADKFLAKNCERLRHPITQDVFAGGRVSRTMSRIRQGLCYDLYKAGHSLVNICRVMNMSRGTVRHGIGRILVTEGVYGNTHSKQYLASRKITITEAQKDPHWTIRIEELAALSEKVMQQACWIHNLPSDEIFFCKSARTKRDVIAARHYAAYVLYGEHGVPIRKICTMYGMTEDQVTYGIGKYRAKDGDDLDPFAKIYQSKRASASRRAAKEKARRLAVKAGEAA